jgi:hypothetical protein
LDSNNIEKMITLSIKMTISIKYVETIEQIQWFAAWQFRRRRQLCLRLGKLPAETNQESRGRQGYGR